ncbi:hypothetical protein, partial [Deinococcus pimensis]|uniref:hypothetical protein n=1 Tax=Deinococcus pimensis TaxID=309888 RepID=UPI000483D756
MRRLTFMLSALTLATTALGAAFLDLPDRAGKAWVVCDALNTSRTLVIGTPDAAGRAVITTLDRRTGRWTHEAWQVGRADPGAGSVYYALKPRAGAPGRPGDAVRLVNPGVSVSPDLYAFTPALVSVTLRGEANECRLLPGTRLLGVTARRTVLVTQDAAGRLTYRSYDFARPGAPLAVPGDGV